MNYHYGAKSYQVLVNGVNGEMSGEYPRSFWKIFFLVVFVLSVAGVVLLLTR